MGEGTYSGRSDFADARVDHHRPYLGQVGDGVAELLRRRLKNGRLWGRYKILHGAPVLLPPFLRIFRLQPNSFVRLSPRYARKSEGCSGGHILHRLSGSAVVKVVQLRFIVRMRQLLFNELEWAPFRGFFRRVLCKCC